MSDNNIIICDICQKGLVTTKMEEMAFRQWSDKGYIQCRATVLMGTCDNCQAKSLGPDSDPIFDAAFQREYDKLP
jgi:hypothetical protein